MGGVGGLARLYVFTNYIYKLLYDKEIHDKAHSIHIRPGEGEGGGDGKEWGGGEGVG